MSRSLSYWQSCLTSSNKNTPLEIFPSFVKGKYYSFNCSGEKNLQNRSRIQPFVTILFLPPSWSKHYLIFFGLQYPCNSSSCLTLIPWSLFSTCEPEWSSKTQVRIYHCSAWNPLWISYLIQSKSLSSYSDLESINVHSVKSLTSCSILCLLCSNHIDIVEISVSELLHLLLPLPEMLFPIRIHASHPHFLQVFTYNYLLSVAFSGSPT